MDTLKNQRHKNVISALKILKEIGMSEKQINDRSALTLLALGDLGTNKEWRHFKLRMIGIHAIIIWIKENYNVKYAENSRETIRRQTLHQFIQGGIVEQNPDDPSRKINSSKNCYQCNELTKDLLQSFNSSRWESKLKNWKANVQTLIDRYRMERDQLKIPVQINVSTLLKLTPGIHNKLISQIINDFGPRFTKGAKVLYIGDTGAKEDFFDKKEFQSLGLNLNLKGKLPDVIFFSEKLDWIFLVESVTSHGPVASKRKIELEELFGKIDKELIFVSAFPDRQMMNKFLSDISWESEVWIADNPSHMIHFNGDKFLGPFKN